MRSFSAATAAPPEVTWRLMATPDDWNRWSPHVRGAWGLGAPEVRAGAAGAAGAARVLLTGRSSTSRCARLAQEAERVVGAPA